MNRRWMLGIAAGLLFSPAAIAKESEEKVAEGSKTVFIRRLHGFTEELPSEYQAEETSYFLFTPKNYTSEKKYPLVLAIAPGSQGKFFFSCWEQAAKKYGFFFAAPNDADIRQPLAVRGQRVLDTLADVEKKFSIDPERIFLTGFGEGGKLSTAVVHALPDHFAGHIPMAGVMFQKELYLKSLRTKLGFYLYDAEFSFSAEETRKAYEILKKAEKKVEFLYMKGKADSLPDAKQVMKIYTWFREKK